MAKGQSKKKQRFRGTRSSWGNHERGEQGGKVEEIRGTGKLLRWEAGDSRRIRATGKFGPFLTTRARGGIPVSRGQERQAAKTSCVKKGKGLKSIGKPAANLQQR